MNIRTIVAAALIGLNLSACDTATTTTTRVVSTADRNVLIVNQTGRTIYRFYGSNVGTADWQEDILGNQVLPSGRSVNINFDDGTGYCNFDFKIEFQDGTYITESNINVCQVGTYTVR